MSTKENVELISTESLKYLSRVVNYDLGIRFNFHMLRHTHATMLLENGSNFKYIQKRLGHSKLSTTMDTYSHVTEKMSISTVDIFENVIK
ncbi:tyrosine-type recombinase/integrase [Clostridium hydrogeniformans]|uniref:tyrosine-type recombinase/integrase n=1 Tax=Clostridium hydrogeniformans TaxID=349933 RepID=UPI003BF96F46